MLSFNEFNGYSNRKFEYLQYLYIFMYDLEISVFRKSNPSPIEAVVGFVTYIV